MKQRKIRIRAILIFGLLWGSINLSYAETGQHGPHNAEADRPKASATTRTALNLPPAAQEGLKLTMREHLEAIGAILGALAREDFPRAAGIAQEELGFPKHHVAMQREEGATFPPAYHELAMAHHATAEELGAVIPTKNFTQILSHLEQTIKACVDCHRMFRLQD